MVGLLRLTPSPDGRTSRGEGRLARNSEEGGADGGELPFPAVLGGRRRPNLGGRGAQRLQQQQEASGRIRAADLAILVGVGLEVLEAQLLARLHLVPGLRG